MVLVESSRSARTELPSEQNQPGRRLVQAAHPAGTCQLNCFCGRCVCVAISALDMVVAFPPPHLLCLPKPACPAPARFNAKWQEAAAEEALGLYKFARAAIAVDVM